MLSFEQIETFKKDGVLILRGFFSKKEIDIWRKKVNLFYDFPQTNIEWREAILSRQGSKLDMSSFPTPMMHSKMKTVYQELNDSIEWSGHNELIARWPDIEADWLGARTPHLDFPLYDRIRTLANSVFYLKDVSEFGGPFMFWRGSHLIAWDYFRQNSDDYLAQGNLSQGQVFKKLMDLMTSEPVSFSAKAGDLLIWDSLLMHSASVNKSNSSRLGVFGRWGNRLKEDEMHFDFKEDAKWSEWSFKPSNNSIEIDGL